jgi:hypothetical protein
VRPFESLTSKLCIYFCVKKGMSKNDEMCSSRFPNNIVGLGNTDASDVKRNRLANICCITRFFLEPLLSGGFALKCEGKLFKTVKLSFTHPFDSSCIGNYFCENGLNDDIIQFDFSEITQKCFMFPMKMPSIAELSPSNPQQKWFCQYIRHSNLY